jgi:copper transport protein
MPLLNQRWRRGIGLALALVIAAAYSTELQAHASLISSKPAQGAVVAQSPAALKLTFNEPVSPLALRLLGPTGLATTLDNVVAAGNTLSALLPAALPQGTHLLSWRVISLDGHPVGGALTFSVGSPSAVGAKRPQEQTNRAVIVAAWLAKLVLYVGLFCGVGGVFYAAWIGSEPLGSRTRRIIAAALECGMLAALLSVGLQGLDVLDLPMPALHEIRVWLSGARTSYGVTASLALAALGVARFSLKVDRPRWSSGFALICVGAALAASGHAAAAQPALVTRPAVFIHGVAVAFWIGALLPLAETMRFAPERSAELLRFSRFIPLVVIALLVSGVALAVVQLGQLDALWTTSYGLVLCGKLVAVLLLIALACVNRYVFTRPAAAGDVIAARRLARTAGIELLIVVVVLGLVATWRFTPPPRSLIAAAQSPVQVHIHGDQAMADITIGPPRTEGRTITVAVLDGRFGPLPAKEVTLVLAKPEDGIEALRMPARPVGDGHWQIDDVRLPPVASFHLRVEILVSEFQKIMLEDKIHLAN